MECSGVTWHTVNSNRTLLCETTNDWRDAVGYDRVPTIANPALTRTAKNRVMIILLVVMKQRPSQPWTTSASSLSWKEGSGSNSWKGHDIVRARKGRRNAREGINVLRYCNFQSCIAHKTPSCVQLAYVSLMLSRLTFCIFIIYLSFVVPIFHVSLIYACAYRTSQQLFLSIHGESSPIHRRVVSAGS